MSAKRHRPKTDREPLDEPSGLSPFMTEFAEPVDRARRTLLRDIERAGHFGHGLDRDRTLLRDAASLIRSLLGLAPNDPLD